MATTYRVEAWDESAQRWDRSLVGNDDGANRFASEAEAEAAIASLRTNGDDWATADYRVVPWE